MLQFPVQWYNSLKHKCVHPVQNCEPRNDNTEMHF